MKAAYMSSTRERDLPRARASDRSLWARENLAMGVSSSGALRSAALGSRPIGNQARLRRVASGAGVHPPLFTPGTSASAIVRRRCSQCASDQEREARVMRKGAEAEPAASGAGLGMVTDLLRSDAGQPLDRGTREYFEPRFGRDFGDVRVHTGSRADQSAHAIGAVAYAVESDLVFRQGAYSPETDAGKRLLAHELAHVTQAGTDSPAAAGSLALGAPNDRSEREADRMADAAQSSPSHASTMTRGSLHSAGSATIRRQPTPASTNQQMIDEARLRAFVRCQIAYQKLAGIGPPSPPGRPDMTQEEQRRARNLARIIFGTDLNMDQVTEIVGNMRNFLTPGLKAEAAAATDPNCASRAAYVVGHLQPIHLCPAFFSSTPEERARTMIHEAAHLAGIGEVAGESYCGVFDCNTSCGGFSVADSWAHFVHCLSGQTPDQPPTVTGGKP